MIKRLLLKWLMSGGRRVPLDLDARFGALMGLGELRAALQGCQGEPGVRAVVQVLMMQRALCVNDAQTFAMAGLADRAAAELGAAQGIECALHEVILGMEGKAMGGEVVAWFGGGSEGGEGN